MFRTTHSCALFQFNYTVVTRLLIFTQIRIFANMIEETKRKQRSVSSSKYYTEYSTWITLHMFAYMHSVDFGIFKFSING